MAIGWSKAAAVANLYVSPHPSKQPALQWGSDVRLRIIYVHVKSSGTSHSSPVQSTMTQAMTQLATGVLALRAWTPVPTRLVPCGQRTKDDNLVKTTSEHKPHWGFCRAKALLPTWMTEYPWVCLNEQCNGACCHYYTDAGNTMLLPGVVRTTGRMRLESIRRPLTILLP